MFEFIQKLFSSKPKYRRVVTQRPFEFLLTEDCIEAICHCIESEIRKKHEGIAYLYGRTDGINTLAIGAIKPDAKTTPGSFSVTSLEMARLVKTIRSKGLQLISQLHTHPGLAYHSAGDVEGLKMVCDGYVSIVLPKYGEYLPSLKDAKFYFYRRGQGFSALIQQNVKIIPKRLS